MLLWIDNNQHLALLAVTYEDNTSEHPQLVVKARCCLTKYECTMHVFAKEQQRTLPLLTFVSDASACFRFINGIWLNTARAFVPKNNRLFFLSFAA